jgi:hypothetical protein
MERNKIELNWIQQYVYLFIYLFIYHSSIHSGTAFGY